MRILTDLKNQQQEDLNSLSHLKKDVHDKTADLAVKCDECQDKNEEILKR